MKDFTMRDKPLILVIEDEDALVTLITYTLEKNGFATTSANDIATGRYLAEGEQPDLIVLDWMLPDGSGIDFCRTVRRTPLLAKTPIIMLTAKSEEQDKIRGLNAGADDYVTKPFSPAELVARVNAVLRRSHADKAEETLTIGDMSLDLITRRATRAGQALDLSPLEFRLLYHFMQHPKRVFSRDQLLTHVWGQDIHVEERTVDVHIKRLRATLGEPSPIRTVRSAGYAFEVPVAD